MKIKRKTALIAASVGLVVGTVVPVLAFVTYIYAVQKSLDEAFNYDFTFNEEDLD